MRILAFLVCSLAAVAAAPSPSDDRAEVRKQGERYAACLLRGDKAGLERLLHKDYRASYLSGVAISHGDKAQAIAYWLTKRVTRFWAIPDSVRMFGDAAIEAGTLSAVAPIGGGRKDQTDTWHGLTYTRVWVREGKVWRLVHEQF
jgi:hypothetical protein